jgi:hypothetical protein
MLNSLNMLKDVSKHIKFNKYGKFKYCFIPYAEMRLIEDFINSLEPNLLYTIIPLISFDGKNEKPHLILSEQILITKYSNPELLIVFIHDQLNIAFIEFDFNLDNKFYFLKFNKSQLK